MYTLPVAATRSLFETIDVHRSYSNPMSDILGQCTGNVCYVKITAYLRSLQTYLLAILKLRHIIQSFCYSGTRIGLKRNRLLRTETEIN